MPNLLKSLKTFSALKDTIRAIESTGYNQEGGPKESVDQDTLNKQCPILSADYIPAKLLPLHFENPLTKEATMIDHANLQYMNGFGNEHETEALPGALPVGQFNPQK